MLKSPIALVCENNTATEVHTITTIAEINTVHRCNLCDYAGDSKNKLAKHMGDIHGKCPCGQCGKKFWLRTELDMHKCSECQKGSEYENVVSAKMY